MLWESRCIGCKACVETCPQAAITPNGKVVETNQTICTRCGACIPHCPTDAREWIGRQAAVAEAMAEIERDVTFYDESGGGVTFSGGEPLMQPEFLLALLQACREKEIHTTLDTSGYAAWETLDRVRPYVNLFLYDVKCIDDELHRQVTGVSNTRILSNLRALAEHGHCIILRVPLVPGVNADAESITALATLATSLPGVERIDLLPYHQAAAGKYDRLRKPYPLPDALPPPEDTVKMLAEMLRVRGFSVKIGG
jgi:pyruvate formate lyase activating enzyme